MKPINNDDSNCINQSSNCIIYDGKDIKCVGIKNGDCLTAIVHELACKLCVVLDSLDVSEYDLACLDLKSCAPQDFKQLLQLLIDKICALEGIQNPTTGGTNGCPDCTVKLAPCFYYFDPKTGDQVVTSQLTDYVTLIGNTICELLDNLNLTVGGLQSQGKRLGVVEKQVSELQNRPAPVPSIVPTCVLASELTPIDVVLQALEQQFCQLRSATGLPDAIFNAIATQPENLNTQPALGTQGGKMDSIPGWVPAVKNLSDSIINMWLTVKDLRSAVTNIQVSCCPTPCNGVSVLLQATMPNINTLLLFFTGSIPAELSECNITGTLFKIADQSGHSINVTIPVVTNMNNPGGYPVVISGTPLNTSDNFTITADLCFKNNTAEVMCQSCLEYIFINTLNCPDVVYVPSLTAMSFSFAHTSGTKTYTVALYDSTGNTLLQSMIFPETNPTTVSGTFNGLTMGTIYKIRIFIIASNGVTTTCPFTVVTTSPNPCQPPSGVSAVITIP